MESWKPRGSPRILAHSSPPSGVIMTLLAGTCAPVMNNGNLAPQVRSA